LSAASLVDQIADLDNEFDPVSDELFVERANEFDRAGAGVAVIVGADHWASAMTPNVHCCANDDIAPPADE